MLVPAAPAAGQERLPEDNAGTGQYVEPVPDAGGDRAAAPGDRGDRGRPLPPETRADLPPGEEGRVLERIASDPGSGAQPGSAGGAGGGEGAGSSGSGGGDESVPADDGGGGALSAVTSAVVDSDNDGTAIVLVLGLMGTVLALVAALRRRRS